MEDASKFEQNTVIKHSTRRKHNELVEYLNQNPDWWNLKFQQAKRPILMALKPMMYELWRTKQLTKKEMADAIRSTGYKISDTEMTMIIEHLGWKWNMERGAKYRGKKREMSETAFDKAVLALSREMPPHKMDPRLACRYYEIINAVPAQTNANFFRATDILCAIERKARHAWGLDQTLEEHLAFNGTEVPEGLKDDDEVLKWITFI